MRLDFEAARRLLREEAERSKHEPRDRIWESRLNEVIEAAAATNKTFIAALGTGLLAKATDLRADPLALKVKGGSPGSHSARALAKDVLTALAAELGIDLGVRGREPLNNQPFFRYDFMSPDMDVRANARPALGLLIRTLTSVAAIDSEAEARAALRTFLSLRRIEHPRFEPDDSEAPVSPSELARAISGWVSAASEGGRRAQAAVVGLYSLVHGSERVITSRVNDPDRRFPGDLVVGRSNADTRAVEAVEVRDKLVPPEDAITFFNKALSRGFERATVVAVAANQPRLDIEAMSDWGSSHGMAVRVLHGWTEAVLECVFASDGLIADVCARAHALVGERLDELEVSESGIAGWTAWRTVPRP